MKFSWCTPLRRDGQTDLSLIPNEIYLVIFEYIAPTSESLPEEHIETFSALALVCRFFCAVALPRVFEHVVFSGKTSGDRMRASRRTTWAKQIVANTELARSVALYVKECDFEYWIAAKEVRWFLSPFSTLYCRAMAYMPNIRRIAFYRSSVNKEHWEAMVLLKQLECLTFSHCSFTENPPDQELSVRAVKLVSSLTPFIFRPIATSTLRVLETDTLETILNLATAYQLSIENLVIYGRGSDLGMEVLLRVFERLRGLKSVTFTASEELMTSPLIGGLSPKQLFPCLRSFTVRSSLSYLNVHDKIPWHDIEKLLSAICNRPDTLPSLENFGIFFRTSDRTRTTLDIVSDQLENMIIPAFPNVKYIRTPEGEICLENSSWKRVDIVGRPAILKS